ncbi:hypothetical protein GPA10_03615 [Streptomyces sp. p1417]|uniref:DUF3592 domain-containing protein n=1 Tax=Streptomyces typhae TaxID=2681492 RepID=A0A6L6WU32_9ACTN|nr:DUF3592 domain-containing protein [Streptomyces typhae]MVO83876.1 hypothetical protein [Streptomyces typhae]
MPYAFAFIGVLFTVMGAVVQRNDRRLRNLGRPAVAVVEERVFRPGQSRPTSVILNFEMENGAAHSTSLVLTDAFRSLQVGDRLDIVYDPANVNAIRAADSVARRPTLFGDRILLVIGCAFLVAAAVAGAVWGW